MQEVIVPVISCLTCLAVGAITTYTLMNNRPTREGFNNLLLMNKELKSKLAVVESMLKLNNISSTTQVASGGHTHATHTHAWSPSPANHAYYEDGSEVGDKTWMDHIGDPVVCGAAEALGLLDDADTYEVVDGAGKVVMSYKFLNTMLSGIRTSGSSAATVPSSSGPASFRQLPSAPPRKPDERSWRNGFPLRLAK